eukprot:6737837-Prymnesium_polylepis.1
MIRSVRIIALHALKPTARVIALRSLAVAQERFKAVSKAFALLSDPERRARYDRLGPEEAEEPSLDSLADWRTIKVPFTAFKDRSFFAFAEQ